ncbi:PglZ domain protein [Bacillus paranthracis]|uniref:PglZ domain protein n=2 Tax=Bacillaceae TaxID=186817 RepID=A0A9X8SLS0_9BACI|nr:PglZ domain protein [Bacillus paranthracis]
MMGNWFDGILEKLRYPNCKIVLVHDQDFLLNDESLLNNLKEEGYEVVRFENSVSFRYLYEQKYRASQNKYKLLVYTNDNIIFPYEYIKGNFNTEVDISTIFPKFSAPILRSMNREDLDALFTVHAQYQGSSSNKDTLEYIVKHLYKISYEIIDSEVELYKLLLFLHYRKREIPQVVQDFLIEKLKQCKVFHNLPIEKLISSAGSFYVFLEEQWTYFVTEYTKCEREKISEPSSLYRAHPFTNDDVWRLMVNLFMEGTISKVKKEPTLQIPKWMKIGIEEESKLETLHEKLNHISKIVNEKLARIKLYKDWIELIDLVAEYKYTAMESNDTVYVEEANTLMMKVNQDFQDWMLKQYHTLISLPPIPKPKMVHHVPHVLHAQRRKNEKVALLVLDGMSFIQWKQVKKHLKENGFSFVENGIFAWVPTLTSVSRQAIFSGSIPFTFSKTIKTTAAEEKYWKNFWEKQGMLKQYVAYQKGLGKEDYSRENILALKRNSVKIYGAVIDVIDKFTHHAVLGEKSLVSNLEIWLQTNYLVNLLADLIKEKYTIYLTADHGNTIAKGIGRISEGVLVDQKGERVRIYSDTILYEDSASKIDAVGWNNAGLPENYNVLLSQYGQAFVQKGEEIVTHGGISIEEVVVPFIKVQQN